MEAQDSKKFEQLVQRMDPQSKLLRAWPLTGGISAQVTALEIVQADGERQKMIVRRHGAVDLQLNPQIAADEFRLLQRLQAAGLAVPRPYYVDAEIFTTPCLVIEYIDGETDFAPADLPAYLRQLAAQLAAIHRVDITALSYLPARNALYTQQLKQRPARLDDSLDEGRIRDALEAVVPLWQINQTTLLHGDYWPGNVLWQAGRLAAVIDWEDASLGDPLADLANSRLETLWAFGADAMQQYTRDYQSLMPDVDFTYLPYWDLCMALRPAFRIAEWAGDATREQAMRAGHKWFVTQAFEALSAE